MKHTKVLGREYVPNRCRKILPGCGTSRPPIRQQDVGHLPAGNGVIGGVPHQDRVAHGAETQTMTGPLEGVDLPKIRGCFEEMRDEDDSRVHSDLLADDRGVRSD